MLDKKFFLKVGPEVVAKFRKHTFMEGKDVDKKKFKGYSRDYTIAKRSGNIKRQASEFKNSTAPVLTSDLMRDWTMRKIGSGGFKFGTLAHGGKVKSLQRKGRFIAKDNKAIPDHIAKYIKD